MKNISHQRHSNTVFMRNSQGTVRIVYEKTLHCSKILNKIQIIIFAPVGKKRRKRHQMFYYSQRVGMQVNNKNRAIEREVKTIIYVHKLY